MWATVVNRDGLVCQVAFTGGNRGSQWPASRVISAQKANTANSFSLPGPRAFNSRPVCRGTTRRHALRIAGSNPVDTSVAYQGPSSNFGQEDDPMVGKRVGGVNVFGGGLALYNAKGQLIGAIGVSGDTSCADHNISWRTRHTLNLDYVPGGVSAATTITSTTRGRSSSPVSRMTSRIPSARLVEWTGFEHQREPAGCSKSGPALSPAPGQSGPAGIAMISPARRTGPSRPGRVAPTGRRHFASPPTRQPAASCLLLSFRPWDAFDIEGARGVARRRSQGHSCHRMLARPGALVDFCGSRPESLDLAGRTLSLHGCLQGPNDLLLGRRCI